jgi:hypothetical protein
MFVCNESINRKIKIKCICESRCIHWVGRGDGTPEDRDEVSSRDVCECDG